MASAAIVGGSPEGAVACSYGLAASEAAGSSLRIGGMLFKPVGVGAQSAAAAAAAQEQAEAAQLIYVVAWEASNTAAPHVQGAPLPPMRHSVRWQLGDGRHLRLHAGRGAASFHTLQGSLKLLQRVTSGRTRPTVALSTQLLMPGMRHASPAHAAVAGLIKVAARENPGQQFAHFTHHAFATECHQLPAEQADMFGVGVAGGGVGGVTGDLAAEVSHSVCACSSPAPPPSQTVCYPVPPAVGALYTPRLEAVPQDMLLAPVPPNRDARLSMHGSVLVTGGLGDIGQLTGHWVASTAARSHVWLLGRTGRAAQSMASSLAAYSSCISMAAGDVAARADMAAALHLVAASGAPAVTGILHAGAVLADAPLGRQTAASLQAVYAPKVPGVLCLLGVTAVHPLQGILTFSSLTAQLGTPGQANYAAANGALEGMSQNWLNRGLRSSSVLWGPWASGLALSNPRILENFQRAGLGAISGAGCWLLLPLLMGGRGGAGIALVLLHASQQQPCTPRPRVSPQAPPVWRCCRRPSTTRATWPA